MRLANGSLILGVTFMGQISCLSSLGSGLFRNSAKLMKLWGVVVSTFSKRLYKRLIRIFNNTQHSLINQICFQVMQENETTVTTVSYLNELYYASPPNKLEKAMIPAYFLPLKQQSHRAFW